MIVTEAPPASPATIESAVSVLCDNATTLLNEHSDLSQRISIYFLVISVLSLIYGISTWIVLPDARNFQNYAFIKVVLVQCLRCAAYVAQPTANEFMCTGDYLHYMLSLALQCWLLVAALCMYQEIVIFFMSLSDFFYLANLFAWGLPAGTILLTYIINSDDVVCNENRVILYNLMESVLVLMNVLCYVRVVLSIWKGHRVLSPSRTSRSVLKSSLALHLAVMPAFLHYISLSTNDHLVDFVLNLGFPSWIIIVWFVCLKSNSEMWLEWCRS